MRQAYAYRELPVAAFRQVLGMLAGEYYATGGGPLLHALRPRISWDRINDRLAPLPGTRLLALSNAGTIPDTGAFGVYLPDGKTRVGELDEEFVYETRTGDVFLLGSQTWRVLEVTENRVVVGDAAGQTPRMPFWNGELPWRPYELGLRIARFRGEVAARLAAGEDRDSLLAWLQADYALDRRSAANLLAYVERMVGALGALSSDRTILVEHFDDVVGELRMVIHSPFGGRVNAAWALALRDALRERLGTPPEVQISDDGILFRLPGMEGELPLDLIRMSAQEARERVLRELPNSPMFGAQFRMAASRALLLPRAHGARRTPLWLQRLKAKELLAQVSRFPDFPLVIEAYRDCMRDVLDVPRLEEVLAGIGDGSIEVHAVHTRAPSPVAARLLFFMIDQYMYEWDAPEGGAGAGAAGGRA